MIISRDMLHESGIDLLFSKAEMVWDNVSIPMQPMDKLTNNWAEPIKNEILLASDPPTFDADRIHSIINAKYTVADLAEKTKQCKLLTKEEQNKLFVLL